MSYDWYLSPEILDNLLIFSCPQYHRAIAQYSGEITRRLADSLILPFNVSAYGSAIQSYVNALETAYRELIVANDLMEGVGKLFNTVTYAR